MNKDIPKPPKVRIFAAKLKTRNGDSTVEVDGKPLRCTGFDVRARAGEFAEVTLHTFQQDLDLELENAHVTIVQHPSLDGSVATDNPYQAYTWEHIASLVPALIRARKTLVLSDDEFEQKATWARHSINTILTNPKPNQETYTVLTDALGDLHRELDAIGRPGL
jgi:hypothetical protein